MTTTKDYIKMFDGGVDFAVHSINQQCHTDFESLAEVITAIRTLKDAEKAKQTMWVPLRAEDPFWNAGGHLND